MHKGFILMGMVLSSYALEQGNEITLTSRVSKATGTCLETWEIDQKILRKNCDIQENCTFLYLNYNVNTRSELFGNISIQSRLGKNKTFSKVELLAVYDNIVEQKIDEFPETTPDSKKFYPSSKDFNFSVIQGYKNFTLGLRGQYFCGSIDSISLFYYRCPASTTELVNFAAIPAPSKTSNSVLIDGSCTEHAVTSSHRLSMTCYYNGTFKVSGVCKCKAGYSNFYSGKRNTICKG